MKKNLKVLVCFFSFVLIFSFFMTGCSENKKAKDKSEEASEDARDIENESDVIKGQPENLDIVPEMGTFYYVDELTGTVVGHKMEISDEYDLWNALIDYGVLTDACQLLKLEVSESESSLLLDFNNATAEYINSMGTTGETEVVGCIVNTYLDTYECNKIRLTVEGGKFITSHGADFSNGTEWINFE